MLNYLIEDEMNDLWVKMNGNDFEQSYVCYSFRNEDLTNIEAPS